MRGIRVVVVNCVDLIHNLRNAESLFPAVAVLFTLILISIITTNNFDQIYKLKLATTIPQKKNLNKPSIKLKYVERK
jgi:hypothetical protein